MQDLGVNSLSQMSSTIARFLRVDTLSLLLSLANVTSHSDVLVLDMLDGIITGAVAERLGGI